jgi:hypothetical protein
MGDATPNPHLEEVIMGEAQTLRSRYLRYIETTVLLCAAIPILGYAQTSTVAGVSPSSFAVNETGAATYTIPIQVPPGIAGMEPTLALAYNSAGGNGPLGLGWHLTGISSVDRCGRNLMQDGFNVGVTYESTDRWCLDGQRLVMVAGSSYGSPSSEYRTDRESYTKVVAVSNNGDGDPGCFDAYTKAGQIIEYGCTPDSRIEATGLGHERTYQVDKISDRMGNSIKFTYEKDSPGTTGDFRPIRIDYAYSGSTPNATVKLIYDTRTDTMKSYVSGVVLGTQKRLINVQTFIGTSTTPIRDYRLAYEYSPSQVSRLTSVTECNGGGATAKCLAPHVFKWNNGTTNAGLAGPAAWTGPPQQSFSAATNIVLTDIDGDGLADLIYGGPAPGTGAPSILFQKSTGSSFLSPVSIGSAPTFTDPDTLALIYASPLAAADTNLDGKAEPIWTANQYADIDGDGLPDIVYTTVDPSLGPSLMVQYALASNPPTYSGAFRLGPTIASQDPDTGAWTLSPMVFGDFNGDGRADIMEMLGTQPYVSLSRARNTSSTGFTPWGGGGFFAWGQQVVPADMNGDGLTDLVYVDVFAGPSIMVQYSTGISFANAVGVASADAWFNGETWDVSPIYIADVNGDGLPDVVSNGNVRLSQSAMPDYIYTFTDSLGAKIQVNPSLLTDSSVYVPDSNPPTYATWPVRDRLKHGWMVVTKSTVASDGTLPPASVTNADGSINGFTTTYKYYGAKTNMLGGGFYGFRRIEESKKTAVSGTCIQTVNEFLTARAGTSDPVTGKVDVWPFQGLTTLVEKDVVPCGQSIPSLVLSQVTNTWTRTLIPNATTGYHSVTLGSTTQTSADLDGSVLPTVTSIYTPDGTTLGNVGTIVVSTPDGYSKTTTNTYNPDDTTNWILGRLNRTTVTSTIPQCAAPPNTCQ